MSSTTAADLIVNTGGSPDNLKQGSDKYNAHWHEYDAVLLTNRKGSNTAIGDVMAVDTANDSSAVADDVVGSLRRFVVAKAVITNAVAGEFGRGGLQTVKSTGTITRGGYIRKSATALAVETTGVAQADAVAPPVGTLGLALTTAAGGFVVVEWFAQTVASGVLDKSGADVTVANTVTQTSLRSVSIPGGALGTAGVVSQVVRATISGSGTGGTCTFRFKFGATTLVTIVLTISGSVDLGNEPLDILFRLAGHNATNAQTAYVTFLTREAGASLTAFLPVVYRGTAAEDSTAAKTLDVTVEFSAALLGNTITMEHWLTRVDR